MTYDAGLVARIEDVLVRLGERRVRQKNVFGGRGFLVGKHTFVIAWDDGILVKVPPKEYKTRLSSTGVTPFAPAGEKAMGRWLVVSPDVIADDPELQDWVQLGLAAIR